MPHLHEKIDFVVDVYLVYKHKVLLRKHDKYHQWFAVGGHIELDEDPNEAAIREVKEEVGMDITLYDGLLSNPIITKQERELIPPFFLDLHSINEAHKHLSLVYFAYAPSMEVHEMVEREKSTEIKWFTKDDLISCKELLPRVRKYALKALEVLKEKGPLF